MGARQAVFACFVASCAFLTVLFSVVRADPGDLPQLKITAEPRIGYAPGHVLVTVYAKPDANNRIFSLAIGATDSGFAASSQRSLDGDNERGELAKVTYKDVPPGNYLVVAALFDRHGKQLASRSIAVKKLARF